MKKLVLLLAVAFSVSMFSCGNGDGKDGKDTADTAKKEAQEQVAPAQAEQAPEAPAAPADTSYIRKESSRTVPFFFCVLAWEGRASGKCVNRPPGGGPYFLLLLGPAHLRLRLRCTGLLLNRRPDRTPRPGGELKTGEQEEQETGGGSLADRRRGAAWGGRELKLSHRTTMIESANVPQRLEADHPRESANVPQRLEADHPWGMWGGRGMPRPYMGAG